MLVKKYLSMILATAVISGCVASSGHDTSLYYWGNYRDISYQQLNGTISHGEQVDALKMMIAQAQNRGKPVPPGIYAHLGMIYDQQGNDQLAIEYFIKEKQLYPESSYFMDSLLKKKMPESVAPKKPAHKKGK